MTGVDDEVVEAELVEETGGVEVELVDSLPAVHARVGLDDIRTALMHLDDARGELAKAGDIDNLAHGVADIGLIEGDLKAVKRQAEADIADLMLKAHTGRGNPKRDVPGLGIVDVPGGNQRSNWDSERLLRKVMLMAIVNGEGEMVATSPTDVVDAIYEVLVDVLPITASLGWRVGQLDKATQEFTGLKKYGIEADDWCDNTPKPRLAKVPKKNPSPTAQEAT